MQLTFEHTQSLGAGTQPQAIHTPENIVQVLFTRPDSQGRIYAMGASTPLGAWASREFNPAYLVCTDVDIEHLKLKYVSASSIFAVWKNETEAPETGTVRHRLAVWAMRQDLSKYLESGTIELNENDPVVKLQLTLGNPGQIVSSENDTILTPGTSLTLFFRAGDSARYIMGRYFTDKNEMSISAISEKAITSTVARNAIGKMLKDQSFDEDTTFPKQNLTDTVIAMLQAFSVDNYWVGTTAEQRGMEFPPDMDGLTGFTELLKTISTWRMKEDLTGQIGIGHHSDSRFTQPSTYTFNRGTDVFSRGVTRDDDRVWSRVCVRTQDNSLQVYRDVNFKFTLPQKKTYRATVPDGTLLADAESYADELAILLADVGIVETFTGPFRPQLMPEDNAQIVSSTGSKLLGSVTTVRHTFGNGGYKTEFTVDSGGRIGRQKISDYIQKISGQRVSSGNVTRLY